MTMSSNILLVSYEFTYGTFSGNGILARSLVKSLLRQGCRVTVWCCRPPPPPPITHTDTCSSKNGKDHPLEVPELSEDQMERLCIVATTISTLQKWHRLDDESAWKEFQWDNLTATDQSTLLLSTKTTGEGSCGGDAPLAILVIDWTGYLAWESSPFSNNLQGEPMTTTITPPPLVYLNFRVYSSGVKDPLKRQWYDERERQALQQASVVVALSQKDKASLLAMIQAKCDDDANNTTPPTKIPTIHVLVPPLRGDFEEFAIQSMKSANPTLEFLDHMPPAALQALRRHYQKNSIINKSYAHNNDNHDQAASCGSERLFITCVVRLSPEKNTRRFVRFLAKSKRFWKGRLIPLLAGSSSDKLYANMVQEELKALCGDEHCVILDSFLPPASLAAVFSRTLVNFHPCSYDAYGMTIIEAAALSVPSIIAAGDHVGASVHVGNGACIEVEMMDHHHHNIGNTTNHASEKHGEDDTITDEAVSQALAVMSDTAELERRGKEAQRRALAWDEDAYGKASLQHLSELDKHWCYWGERHLG